MEREITGKRPSFRPSKQGSSFYRILLWLSLILAGIWVLLGYQRGQVKALFLPTPTPTRAAQSYVLEAQAYFDAGKLDDPDPPLPTPPNPDAIDTYQKALKLDPNDAQALAELARIQAYSTQLLRNDTERLARLKEALDSANRAVELAPDDSTIRAIRAFVLDWYASSPLISVDQSQQMLAEANGEANHAFNLDTNNSLALAYYAEILVDQQKWSQAESYAYKAVTQDPNSMDTHRVYGYVLESLGLYNKAIQQYIKAAEITPNLTFLYILIGRLYREGIKNPDLALEYFDRAAAINKQLDIQNPLPYIEIARTYTQQGEFFAASRNAEKALEFDSTNASTYGQLGIIYIKARNYEGAMPLLKCAVRGCTTEENNQDNRVDAAVQGLPLTNLSVAYYYVEYGTVMAFLSRLPDQNYCPQARTVLQEVRAAYPNNQTLMAIVQDSEGICNHLEGGSGYSAQGNSGGETPTPGPTEPAGHTPEARPSPTPGM